MRKSCEPDVSQTAVCYRRKLTQICSYDILTVIGIYTSSLELRVHTLGGKIQAFIYMHTVRPNVLQNGTLKRERFREAQNANY